MSNKSFIQVCRIYPTNKQKEKIENTFNACNEVHNLILKERRYVYNKFILYARRCYINKMKVDEDRFFKNNISIDKFKQIDKKYKNIDKLALYNEQLAVIEKYDRYFAGMGAFPTLKKENKYGIKNINGNIQINKNYIKLPCLGNVKKNKSTNDIKNINISKALITCNKKGEYFAVFILNQKYRKNNSISNFK